MVKICDACNNLRPFVIVSNGCSFRNLALKFADSLILIQIDRMFELTAEQEDYLEPKTEEFVEWFKKEKVPLFINELITWKSV